MTGLPQSQFFFKKAGIMETPRNRPSKRRPLTAEQQELASRYIPMARGLARPLRKTWPWASDDFESAALFALVEAAESFDPARQVKFGTFARFRIKGALRDVQRKMMLPAWKNKRRKPFNPDAPPRPTLKLEEAGRLLFSGIYEDASTEPENRDAFEAMLRQLPDKHARTCREIYQNGCSQSEVAQMLGCSQSRMSYVHREALAMLNGSWYTALSEKKTSDA